MMSLLPDDQASFVYIRLQKKGLLPDDQASFEYIGR